MSSHEIEPLGNIPSDVIHVFPQGKAIVGQTFKEAKHASETFKQEAKDSSEQLNNAQYEMFERNLASTLLQFGLLTPAQLEVAIHDQKVMNVPLIEVLILRGWVLGANANASTLG